MRNSSPQICTWWFSPDLKITIDPHRLTFPFYPRLDSCRLRFVQSSRRLLLPIHSVVCLVTFGLSLPVAISLFPQMSQVQYISCQIWPSAEAASRPDGSGSSWEERKKSNYIYTTSHCTAPTHKLAFAFFIPDVSSHVSLKVKKKWS